MLKCAEAVSDYAFPGRDGMLFSAAEKMPACILLINVLKYIYY